MHRDLLKVILWNTKTLLGYVGTTGNAEGTPPHLHFGIYTSDGAINPAAFVSRPQCSRTDKRQINPQDIRLSAAKA